MRYHWNPPPSRPPIAAMKRKNHRAVCDADEALEHQGRQSSIYFVPKDHRQIWAWKAWSSAIMAGITIG